MKVSVVYKLELSAFCWCT